MQHSRSTAEGQKFFFTKLPQKLIQT
jgi:hypothetical protein